MASSLRLITSNLITRSFRPTLVSGSRFLSIDPSHRSYSTTTTPTDDVSDRSWLKVACPKISALSFEMEMYPDYRNLKLKIPSEGVKVDLAMPGLKEENMRACAEQNNLFVQGNFEGMLNENPPKDGNITNIIANEILASFRDITAERSWAYYDMFYDRSILGKGLCPIIRALSRINSFSIYKKENDKDKRISIKMSMPGKQDMQLTTQGLSVSLGMSGLRRENVKVFFDYDTLFIEGKTKKEHYITCINVPEGIHKKHNMFRREMKGGVFSTTLPCRVEKEKLREIKDKLKPKLCITS